MSLRVSISLVSFYACLLQCTVSALRSPSFYYLEKLNTYLVNNVPTNDFDANMEKATEWLSDWDLETRLDTYLMKDHYRYLEIRKKLDLIACGPDDADFLRFIQSMDDFPLSRVKELMKAVKKSYADACIDKITNKIRDYLNDSSNPDFRILSALSVAGKTSEVAYKAMSSNLEDPLAAAVQPRSTIRLQRSEFNQLYDRYILEPCKRHWEKGWTAIGYIISVFTGLEDKHLVKLRNLNYKCDELRLDPKLREEVKSITVRERGRKL